MFQNLSSTSSCWTDTRVRLKTANAMWLSGTASAEDTCLIQFKFKIFLILKPSWGSVDSHFIKFSYTGRHFLNFHHTGHPGDLQTLLSDIVCCGCRKIHLYNFYHSGHVGDPQAVIFSFIFYKGHAEELQTFISLFLSLIKIIKGGGGQHQRYFSPEDSHFLIISDISSQGTFFTAIFLAYLSEPKCS